MILETSVYSQFNRPTRLIARQYFIELVAAKYVSDITSL